MDNITVHFCTGQSGQSCTITKCVQGTRATITLHSDI